MSFTRAFLLALMTGLQTHLQMHHPGFVASILLSLMIFAAFGALWHINPDPLPGAVRKGLEDFAKEYRR